MVLTKGKMYNNIKKKVNHHKILRLEIVNKLQD